MFAIHPNREFDPRQKPQGRFRLSLRRHSADHPMAMFATLAVAALVTAALMPPAGVTMSSHGAGNAVPAVQRDLPAKGPRLVNSSDADAACQGQAWGAESAQCLSVIARESGREGAQMIRLIAADGPSTNIF